MSQDVQKNKEIIEKYKSNEYKQARMINYLIIKLAWDIAYGRVTEMYKIFDIHRNIYTNMVLDLIGYVKDEKADDIAKYLGIDKKILVGEMTFNVHSNDEIDGMTLSDDEWKEFIKCMWQRYTDKKSGSELDEVKEAYRKKFTKRLKLELKGMLNRDKEIKDPQLIRYLYFLTYKKHYVEEKERSRYQIIIDYLNQSTYTKLEKYSGDLETYKKTLENEIKRIDELVAYKKVQKELYRAK